MKKKLVLLSVLFSFGCGGKTGRFNGIVSSYDRHAWVMPWFREAILVPEGLPYDVRLPEDIKAGDCVLVIVSAENELSENSRLYISVRRNNVPLGRARWDEPNAYVVFQAPETNVQDTAVYVTAVGGEIRVHLNAFRVRDRACGGNSDEPMDRERVHQ